MQETVMLACQTGSYNKHCISLQKRIEHYLGCRQTEETVVMRSLCWLHKQSEQSYFTTDNQNMHIKF